MSVEVIIWGVYILFFLFLARLGKGHDLALSGAVGFFIQSFSYVATYVSAVALIGFGGLAYMYGMQMMLIAFGNMLLGTWLVYKCFAWRTKELQMRLQARTPAELISRGHNSIVLRKFLGIIFAFFLSIYASAAIKGAAFMLQSVFTGASVEMIIFFLACLVGLAVWWGGLRGVLLTEAMQGCVMLIGIILLGYSVLTRVGGFFSGFEALAALPPSSLANNGFTSLSSGYSLYFIMSLVVVTSVAVWAQPQMIQRHFALSSKKETKKSLWLASFTILVLLGGMYYISALSRLILPEISNSDTVIPILVDLLLPSAGKQLFVLAVASASISSCTALFHIASVSLTEDLRNKEDKTSKTAWACAILACVLITSGTALLKGHLIAVIHTTSWSLIASAALVPYLSLLFLKHKAPKAALFSSLFGFLSCLAFYLLFTPQTALLPADFFALPKNFTAFPPFVVGFIVSALTYILVFITLEKNKNNYNYI